MKKVYHNSLGQKNPIYPHHLAEWEASGVDTAIARLNVVSVERDAALDYLLIAPELPRNNGGRVKSWILDNYKGLTSSGWYCAGVDLESGGENPWGQVKFDIPRVDRRNDKTIKYESPLMSKSGYYALRVPDSINQEITGQDEVELWQQAIARQDIPLYITEGAKKAGSLLSRGKLAIGLPGINSGCRRIEGVGLKLIPALQLFAQKGRKIIVCFDCNEKPATANAVASATLSLGRLFKKHKCKVEYLEWEKYKGIDDYLVNNPDSFPSTKNVNNKAVELQSGLELKGVTDTINCRYLDLNNTPVDSDADIVGIRSAKNTGKTGLTVAIAASYPQRKILAISFREKLAIEQARRFDIPYRREVKKGSSKGYSLCIDSLHDRANPKFIPNMWTGAVVIMDEIEQIVWHLLSSATCNKKRIKIINTLRELIEVVLGTGGKLIVADADLSSVSIDFLKSLSDIKPVVQIIDNQFDQLSKGIKLYNYSQSTPDKLLSDLNAKLEAGEKALLVCGAAKVSSLYSTKSLTTFFSDRLPHLKIGRLDGDVQIDCSPQEYLTQYDLAIVSPAIESGVSIDEDYFDSVWCIAQGTQNPNAVAQVLARVRTNVPRYLWCNYRGLNFIGNGETSPQQIIATTEAKAAYNLRILNKFKGNAVDFSLDTSFPVAIATWAKYASWHNYQNYYYRNFVLHKLSREYQTKEVLGDDELDCRAGLKQAKQQNLEEYVEAIEAIDLERPNNNVPLKLVQKRAYLEDTYGKRNLTPEIILADEKGELDRLRLHYLLETGESFSDKNTTKTLFSPDLAKNAISGVADILRELDIMKFINPKNIFSADSLKSWFERLGQYRRDLNRYLGFSFGQGEQPIKVVQRMLKFFLGVKLTFIGKQGARGQQQRYYQGYKLSGDRREVFAYWLVC